MFGKSFECVGQIDDLFLTSEWFCADPANVGDKPENALSRSTTDLFIYFVRALSVKRNQLSASFLGLLILGRVRCPRTVKALFSCAPFSDGVVSEPTDSAAASGGIEFALKWQGDFACLPQHARFHIRVLMLLDCVAKTIDRLGYDAVNT